MGCLQSKNKDIGHEEEVIETDANGNANVASFMFRDAPLTPLQRTLQLQREQLHQQKRQRSPVTFSSQFTASSNHFTFSDRSITSYGGYGMGMGPGYGLGLGMFDHHPHCHW
jgi:hypothetical protein